MERNDSIKVSKEDLASMDATNKNQLKTEKERVLVVAQDALMRLECSKVKIECEKVHLELDRTESFLLRLSLPMPSSARLPWMMFILRTRHPSSSTIT